MVAVNFIAFYARTLTLISCLLLLFHCSNPTPHEIIWREVQFWGMVDTDDNVCIDTTKTWQEVNESVQANNVMMRIKAQLIVQQGKSVEFVDLSTSNQRMVQSRGTIDRHQITTEALSAKHPYTYDYKIIKKTPSLLFITRQPGILEVYQNTALPDTSMSKQDIINCIIATCSAFGKPVSFCPY